MTDRSIIRYGGITVPYSVMWTGEQDKMFVDKCRHVGHLAICEPEARGQGKPVFSKPHMNRQREIISKDLCDLCAKPLKLRTKVSLSHSRVVATGGAGPAVMQVEPMLHKECALECVGLCPALKRDIKAGTLFVRQVQKWRHQIVLLTSDAVQEFCGHRQGDVAGHAKVELIRWIDRDLTWLSNTQDK